MTESARPLAGRCALITGVSRRKGIGFAIAHRLASLGAHITVQGFPPHDAEYLGRPAGAAMSAAVEALRGIDPGVASVEADFSEADAAGRVVTAAVAARGPLDILVANHARSSSNSLDDVTAEEL